MNASASLSISDQKLLQLLTGSTPSTISDVIAVMRAIDGLLSVGDGLKWFNLLYMNVTQQIDTQPASAWKNPAWLTHLDIVFAGFYFRAIADWLNGAADVPSSWRALLESRFTGGIDRIQFAVAGMNAHINHDLALALLQTDADLKTVSTYSSPQHDDYERVNGILQDEMPAALAFLATGIVGQLAQDTGKIGRLLAIWNIRAARDLAWDFADHLRTIPAMNRTLALAAQDQMTGVLGRSILLMVDPSAKT
jgi:hypothetical protein